MTKLVIFDLDGVLIDSKDYHYDALNEALGEEYAITREEHVSTYDGLPTTAKLELLSKNKGLPADRYEEIWKAKQENTLHIFKTKVDKDYELMGYFQQLVDEGYKVAVASNSIRNTVKIILLRLGLLEFVDIYVSNEDVVRNKPFPSMYWKCMMALGALPDDTVILEDSHIGRQCALDSKCHLVPIENRSDLNQAKIDIQVVTENLNIKANYTFIVQKEHYEKYSLQHLLNLIAPNCNIVQVDGITEGAACTTLLAKEFIDNDEPLLMANSDQFVEWDSNETLYAFSNGNCDGGIITFPATHPKWSYAKLGEDGYVSEVAEKKPISEHATVGIYWWAKGSDYVKYAEQMIEKDIRVNNEYYVCPVFNEAIGDGKKVRIKEIDKEGMWGIGTPEDLNYFLEHYHGEF